MSSEPATGAALAAAVAATAATTAAGATTPAAQTSAAPPPAAEETARGRRRVNFLWEVTQSLLASVVTLTGMSMCVVVVIRGSAIPELLSMSVGLIIGFYFGRTNHTAMGGVGRAQVGDAPQRRGE